MDTVPANDITLYAKWTINQYIVSFDSQGGSAVDDIQADYLTKIDAPAATTKTGYTFAGWYRESVCTNTWVFTTDTIPDQDITLYAKWTVNQYSVSFNSQGGTAVGDIKADYGSKITAPSAPTKTGYTIGGWYKKAACINAWVFATDTVPAKDITLYAKWTINICTVIFDSQGGSIVPYISVDCFTTITEPATPTCTGNTFAGWYKEATGVHAWNSATDKVSDNSTLYAKWTINTYMVSFNSQGGTTVTAKKTNYNTTITAPVASTKTRYTFAGWYKETDCTHVWDFATDKVTGNITLYTKWTINTCTITFNSQGGSIVPSITTNYNSTINIPPDPTRSGYTFAGWYKESTYANAWMFATDKVKSNITLYAKWTTNRYTVIFNSLGGSLVASKVAQYNETITAPAVPTRTGYSFAGWFKEATCINTWNFAENKVTGNKSNTIFQVDTTYSRRSYGSESRFRLIHKHQGNLGHSHGRLCI